MGIPSRSKILLEQKWKPTGFVNCLVVERGHTHMYRCGLCGKLGHNRQTCGKTSAPVRAKPALPAQTTIAQPRHEPSGMRETFTAFDRASAVGVSTVPEPAQENAPVTAEELSVWWNLSSGLQIRGDYLEDEALESLGKLLSTIPPAPGQRSETKKFLRLFHEEVRVELARSTEIGDDTVNMLAHDPSWRVRAQIGSKGNLPYPLAKKLLNDRDVRVSSAVLSACGDLSEDDLREFHGKKVGDGEPEPANPREKFWWTNLLGHRNCPEEFLTYAAGKGANHYTDNSYAVALSNPKTPARVLEEAYHRECARSSRQHNVFLCCVLENPSTPRSVVTNFFENYSHTNPAVNVSAYLAAVRNPNLSGAFIDEEYRQRCTADSAGNADASKATILYSLLSNPRITEETVRNILATDPVPQIKNLARKVLQSRQTAGK